ncbi:hypothetical protein [Microbispora bryophytorum]|uniref:hypothetical protein n=1 Tax=Microbispora bryophytorum TaxID=1460882 RepID=UPI0033EA4CFF
MTCHDIRMWLLSVTAMAAVAWVTTLCSLLVLVVVDKESIDAWLLTAGWTLAAPGTATICAVRLWQRVRVARRLYALGKKHARLFENVPGEISISLR